MANYARNYTGIYQVKYQSGDWQGVASFRYKYVFGPNPGEFFVPAVGLIFEKLAPMLFSNFAYISARIIPANQTESYPWALPSNGETVAGEAENILGKAPEDEALFCTFEGKSGTSKARVRFGGLCGAIVIGNSGSKPWRTTTSDWAQVGVIQAALNASGMVAPNNGDATWLPYMNFKYDDKIVENSRNR